MSLSLVSNLLGGILGGGHTSSSSTNTHQSASNSSANANASQFNAALNNAYQAGLSQGVRPINIYNYAGGGSANSGALSSTGGGFGLGGHSSHGQTGFGVVPNTVSTGYYSIPSSYTYGSGFGSLPGLVSSGGMTGGSTVGGMSSGGMSSSSGQSSHSTHTSGGASTTSGSGSSSAGLGGIIGNLLGGITGGSSSSGGGLLGGGLLGGGLLGGGGGLLGGVGQIAGLPLGLFSNLVGHDSAAKAAGNGDVMGWLVNTFDHTGHTHDLGGASGNGSSSPLAIVGTIGQEAGGLVGLDKIFGSAQDYDARNGTNYSAGGSSEYGITGGLSPVGGLLGGLGGLLNKI
ncbi:hypothetical protein [Thiofilum flexile]|uniref:hypothetical protein n=1 Tax=Thiofilum flexile TaxID=125627 RepID=UPI00037919CD|nr:hypothetical protein [Thiofilum flexile]